MKVAIKGDTFDVGVIVGRFQVPELHDAHEALIAHVMEKHDKVIIFLGLSPLKVTVENPLDFEARKQMILQAFPKVNVLYIKDHPSDTTWSKNLDGMVEDILTPSQTAVLYGGRDSFIAHYTTNKYPVQELEQNVWISGNEIRKHIGSRSVKASPDYRAGVVWATQSRYPTVFSTVDVAIFNDDCTKLLLGQKASDEGKYRFVGGFVDPTDPSFEAAARREAQEETGSSISDPKYIGSCRVEDWRYRGEQDCIMTHLFVAKHQFGSIQPADDLDEVRWFDMDPGIPFDAIVDTHQPLLSMLTSYMTRLQDRN